MSYGGKYDSSKQSVRTRTNTHQTKGKKLRVCNKQESVNSYTVGKAGELKVGGGGFLRYNYGKVLREYKGGGEKLLNPRVETGERVE